MPRLSRFLFGNWLVPSNLEFNELDNCMSAAYNSPNNNNHHSRSVNKIEKGWEIKDEIRGNLI